MKILVSGRLSNAHAVVVGQVNKRVFNPRALKNGTWPVLRHTGRSSRKAYRTPLDAHRADNGYVFVVYGRQTDWVQNVIASGTATLEIDGEEVALTSPRLVTTDEAFAKLAADTKRPPQFLRVSQCLEMDIAA